MILTENGQTPIELIQKGDSVYATDPETGESGYRQVVQTFERETKEIVRPEFQGEEIITTPTHPFYSPQKGWLDACKLRAGDILVTSNGEYVILEKTEHEILESPVRVFNFEVEDLHTYYVGSTISVLVHNSCKNPGGRHGGAAHRAKVEEVKSDLRSKGWDVSLNEHRQYLPNGTYRYPDIIATKDRVTEFYQIGKTTSSGIPIARERQALQDLLQIAKTYFVPYDR